MRQGVSKTCSYSWSGLLGRKPIFFTHHHAAAVAITVEPIMIDRYQPISAGVNWNTLVWENTVAIVFGTRSAVPIIVSTPTIRVILLFINCS